MSTIPRFIDLEASSLSLGSYPIEIAWNDAQGCIEQYLIRPDGIPTWVDWNKQSAKVHGITRKELSLRGEEPLAVYQRLCNALEGETVYSDNPDYDALWLARLCDACCRPYPALDLRHVDELLIQVRCDHPLERLTGLRELVKIKQDARNRIPGRHRADWDVQYLMELWRLASRRRQACAHSVTTPVMAQPFARHSGGVRSG